LSDFKEWKQISHANTWLIFPENIGKRIAIDEVALSQGELYTIITNKKAKGRSGSIMDHSQKKKVTIIVLLSCQIYSAQFTKKHLKLPVFQVF
jgi:transposase